MKLLLDEMITPVVARRLREQGRDVEAVDERKDLRGLSDEGLFEFAQTVDACLVTYNRDDFLDLDRRHRSENRRHAGIVILNPRRFPQGRSSIGQLITALDRLIENAPPYESFVHWLP